MRGLLRRAILDEVFLRFVMKLRPSWGKCVSIPSTFPPGLGLRSPISLLAVLSAITAVMFFAHTAWAQDESREEVHFVGAHDIRVAPINLNLGAGSAQYAVFVSHPETGDPVPDARVVLIASNSEEANPGWAIAINSPAVPDRYDVNLKLDSTGEWAISADVSSPLGADLVDVTTLEVPSVNRLTQGTWVFLGVFVLILGGIAYVWLSARRDYRRKRAAQADSQ